MKISGEIYKKRTYFDHRLQRNVNICFMKSNESINIKGSLIKFIPIITEGPLNYDVGSIIELDGEIRFENIMTSMGIRSVSPIPVIRKLSLV